MDEKEYQHWKKRIGYAARKFGANENDIEDITQEVLCKWASRKFKRGQTVDQAVIDCLRKQYGDKRTGSFDARKAIQNATSLDAEVNNSFRRFVEFSLSERNNSGQSYGLFSDDTESRFTENLTEDAKFFLLNKGSKIAKQTGLTEGRISQKKREIEKKIERDYVLWVLGVKLE